MFMIMVGGACIVGMIVAVFERMGMTVMVMVRMAMLLAVMLVAMLVIMFVIMIMFMFMWVFSLAHGVVLCYC